MGNVFKIIYLLRVQIDPVTSNINDTTKLKQKHIFWIKI